MIIIDRTLSNSIKNQIKLIVIAVDHGLLYAVYNNNNKTTNNMDGAIKSCCYTLYKFLFACLFC